MKEYVKRENPYRDGGDYHALFGYMQKSQVYTIKGLISFCMDNLHLTHKQAKYNVNILNSPREKGKCYKRRGYSDPRGSVSAEGHLYYAEKLERKFVTGVKQPQYFRLRWREVPLDPKKRVHSIIQVPERMITRVNEKIIRERV